MYHGEGTQEDWENITLASLLGGIVINTAGVGGGHGWSIRSAACITWSMERDWRP